MRRPGYPRDPATRVNGVAGVTGYPARMLSSASRPFPPRDPLFLTSPCLSPSLQCASHYSPSAQRKREDLLLFLVLFEDAWERATVSKGALAFGLRWNGWIGHKDSCECIEVCSSSDVCLDLDYWWRESRGRVGRSRRNFEIDEGFGNLTLALWSLLACILRSLFVRVVACA